MRRFLATCGIIITLTTVVAPFTVSAFSECYSERKGYCIRLESNNSSLHSSARGLSGFAAVAFPGLEFLSTYGIDFDSDIGKILSALYNFGVVIAGISALIMFIYGGVRYLTAAGSTTAVSDAKNRMFNAVFGLVLIALSYLILYTINPDFTLTLKLGKLCEALNTCSQSTTQSSSQQQPPAQQQPPTSNIRAKCSQDDFVGSPADCITHCSTVGGTCTIVPSQSGQAVCPIDGFIGFPAACIPHCDALGGTCKLIPQ